MEGLNWKYYSCGTYTDPELHGYFMMASTGYLSTGNPAKLWLIHDTDPEQNRSYDDATVDHEPNTHNIFTRTTGWVFPRSGTKEIIMEEFLTATTGVVWK